MSKVVTTITSAYVSTTFSQEAWHRHNVALDYDHLRYLNDLHRHLFKVRVVLQDEEASFGAFNLQSRAIEMFALHAAATAPPTPQWIEEDAEEDPRITHTAQDMARILANALYNHYISPFVHVEVLEDGENGGICQITETPVVATTAEEF